MNTNSATTVPVEMNWLLPLCIVGGFLIIFPMFWCFVLWILSRAGGWHQLATRYGSGDLPVTGDRHAGVTGMVGGVSYRSVLIVNVTSEGFFLNVMALFRFGHPRLFIPWSDIRERKPFTVLWWNAMKLSIGNPVIATIRLPANLVSSPPPLR